MPIRSLTPRWGGAWDTEGRNGSRQLGCESVWCDLICAKFSASPFHWVCRASLLYGDALHAADLFSSITRDDVVSSKKLKISGKRIKHSDCKAYSFKTSRKQNIENGDKC